MAIDSSVTPQSAGIDVGQWLPPATLQPFPPVVGYPKTLLYPLDPVTLAETMDTLVVGRNLSHSCVFTFHPLLIVKSTPYGKGADGPIYEAEIY